MPGYQVEPESRVLLHIDVHPIRANPDKGEDAHQHFDFRYLFRTAADLVELQEEEAIAYSWQFAAARLPIVRFTRDQTPSCGLRSGA